MADTQVGNVPVSHEVNFAAADTTTTTAPAPTEPVTPAPVAPIKLGYFTRLKNWLKVHVERLPAIEVQISSGANYLVPFVEELDTLVDPGAAVIVNPILDAIKVGLGALAITIQDATDATGKTNIATIFASLKSNATALEAAFKVKDTTMQARVTDVLTLISGEISAMSTTFGA